MTTRSTTVLLIAGLMIALLAAGCGRGSDETTSAVGDQAAAGGGAGESDAGQDGGQQRTIPKKRFLAKANAICDAVVQQVTSETFPAIEAEFDSSQQRRATVEAELAQTVMAPTLHAEADRIRKLGSPPGDTAEVELILASIDALADEIQADPESFTGRSSTDPFAESRRLATRYGLDSCPYG